MTFASSPGSQAGEFKPGDIIGGAYEIIDLIGHGSMGNVYRARHQIMLEEYALKTLRAEKLTDVSWKRFQLEAQSIAKMNHPNIVTIYNFGLHAQTIPYYVMAQLQGKTIEEMIDERGPLPVEEVLPIFVEVCKGMGYAHQKSIIHRDIKPPNILILDKPQGGSRVKIVDFGIAKITGDGAEDKQQLTNIGEVCGSPLYMSPEQCEGSTIDARSDIYSLGCTLYESLTGAPPFRGRNVVDTMLKHQSERPLSLKNATGGREFHPMLERVVAAMLAKSPADRYQNMATAAQDLQAIIDGVAAPPEITSSARVASVKPQTNFNAPPAVSTPNHQSQFAPPEEQDKTVLVQPPPAQNPASSFAPQSFDMQTPTLRMKDGYAKKESAQSFRSGSSFTSVNAVNSIKSTLQEAPEERSYDQALPSHFLRLMIGSFIVIIVLMAAIGYWWIQPSTSAVQTTSPPSLDLVKQKQD
ncbi:MAG: protein kinase [Cyanobacteria bacterium REEB67]|nr:protein kinase [Cyanobacteria bacterium REEB67]